MMYLDGSLLYNPQGPGVTPILHVLVFLAQTPLE